MLDDSIRTSENIDGFDPLMDIKESNKKIEQLLEESKKRDVLNILRSYTGFFDLLSEALQNSLDAVEKKYRAEGNNYTPNIWIFIDVIGSKVKIVDNGIGMSLEEFLYCPRPNVSFKDRRDLRGYKGVGSTFLAYGFTFFKLQSKRNNDKFSAALHNGRQWAEDTSGTVIKPVFRKSEFDVRELDNECSGTSVEVIIGKSKDERPNLQWFNVNTAKQWLKILRLKTPVGGVYLKTAPFSPHYYIEVTASNGEITRIENVDNICYYYPHEFEIINKAQDIKAIKQALDKITGDTQTKHNRLPAEYKRLDCIWEIWGKEDIISEESPFNSGREILTDDSMQLIDYHDVAIYGCFLKSRTLWDYFQKNELNLRSNVKLMDGGLQLASDYMIQGDLITIPLTTAAGYQNFALIIIHFKDGNPDVGRKVFQPELKELAEFLSKKAVAEFRKYRNLLGADTGASPATPSKELYDWKKTQEDYSKKNPLLLKYKGNNICIISKPQQEQDVIALYHQLVGMRLIQGLQFFATSAHEQYDSLFIYNYDNYDKYHYDKIQNPFGVNIDLSSRGESPPLILEYKYSFDALNRDVQTEIKNVRDINFVVAWESGKEFSSFFELQSLLISDEGSTRSIFGATHKAYLQSNLQFEVLILEELLSFMNDPKMEEANQRKKYANI